MYTVIRVYTILYVNCHTCIYDLTGCVAPDDPSPLPDPKATRGLNSAGHLTTLVRSCRAERAKVAELSRALADSADSWALLEAAVCQRLATLADPSAPHRPAPGPAPGPAAATPEQGFA